MIGIIGSTALPATVLGQAGSPGRASREPPVTVRWSFKGTGVFTRPDQTGLLRLRLEPTIRLGPHVSFEAAYEHRVLASSGPAGDDQSALPVLPPDAEPAYRISPLDWQIASGDRATWRHEVDRAVLRWSPGSVRISAGRQAIGWGRGVLFGAMDLFAPFSPFEADREWRRGADAVRVDVPLASSASADLVMAFGDDPDMFTYAARLRAFAGNADVEAVGGWRARDVFAGAATSLVIGQAEVHGEVALFRTPAVVGSAAFGARQNVIKVVVGGSSLLDVGNGILLYVEYHYSGFGAASADAIAARLTDPVWVARVLRGDTQILTRHALAALTTYEWSPLLSGSMVVIQEPTDGSGVVTPSVTVTFGDYWSLVGSVYLAHGRSASASSLGSAYGNAANTALVQVRVYR